MNNRFKFLGLSFRIVKNKDNYDLYYHNIYLYSSNKNMKESFIKKCIDENVTEKDFLTYISNKYKERYTLKT